VAARARNIDIAWARCDRRRRYLAARPDHQLGPDIQ
jgi:hypothetical protein